MADDRLGDGADVAAAGSEAPLRAPVGVAVQRECGATPVDRLAKEVGPEEREDLQPFTRQRASMSEFPG